MRAVNLLPPELRRGGGGAAGRSQGAAHVLIGALAGLLLLGVLFAVAHHQRADLEAQLAPVTREADAAQARATALASFTQFAALRTQRVQSISTLAAQRVDWAADLRGIASVLPNDVKLLSLTGALGTTGGGDARARPGVRRGGVGARPRPPRGAQPRPAQRRPPRPPTVPPSSSRAARAPTLRSVDVIDLLRSVPRVLQVSLSSSSKGAARRAQAPARAGAEIRPSIPSSP